jgi:hypothetical protein
VWRLLGPSDEDRAAGFELAVSTRHFARRAQKVVDDKLSFSATLMRAGEVEAANRLLAEVEHEVLQEEAALLEKVAEVKVAHSGDRKPVTRLRLARAMAVAMLGSTVLASSAVGMAVVGLFRDDNAAQVGTPPGRDDGESGRLHAKSNGAKVERLVAGVKLKMTGSELRRFRQLTTGGVTDQEGLESFLLGILPTPLAEKVQMALILASEQLPAPIKQEIKEASIRLNDERKKATGDEPDAKKTEPPEEESPEPSPSDDGKGDDQEDEDGDSEDLPIVGDDDPS